MNTEYLSFYLCLQFISSVSYNILPYRAFSSLVKFISKYFFSDVLVNEIEKTIVFIHVRIDASKINCSIMVKLNFTDKTNPFQPDYMNKLKKK